MVHFSQAQQSASDAALHFVQHPSKHARELLIWAVTGAGKTETVFAAIAEVLSQGKHVLIATPRKDVVMELAPRLKTAFPNIPLIALHGESTQKGEIGPFVIATTHQAINFYRYFDLVILDEVDAFPYHNNAMLQRAVELARANTGQLIYLTATPPKTLLARAKKGLAELVSIPCRHHGYPLVVPKIIIESKLNQLIRQQKLTSTIRTFLQHLLTSQRQGFLFVPKIEWIKHIANAIGTYLVNKHNVHSHSQEEFFWVEGTHASDPRRKEKIEAFRQGKIRLIVTTTILERGVTIPSTDCLVVCADAPIFDDSALVQMAGRVGRSADDPHGLIIYLGSTRSAAMVQAVKHIRSMNRLARAKGYLIEKSTIKWHWLNTFLSKIRRLLQKRGYIDD